MFSGDTGFSKNDMEVDSKHDGHNCFSDLESISKESLISIVSTRFRSGCLDSLVLFPIV